MLKNIFITVNFGNLNLLVFKKYNNLILSDFFYNNVYNLSKVIGIFPITNDNFFFVQNSILLFKIKN